MKRPRIETTRSGESERERQREREREREREARQLGGGRGEDRGERMERNKIEFIPCNCFQSLIKYFNAARALARTRARAFISIVHYFPFSPLK
jgi:hypothetical protein